MPHNKNGKPGEGSTDKNGDAPREGAGAHIPIPRGVDVPYRFGDVGISVVFFVGGVGHFWFGAGGGGCGLLSFDVVAAGYSGGG